MTDNVGALERERGSALPCVDYITMTNAQIRVLDRMSDDLGYPFADVAADTGLPEPEVRRITRHFHAMGMTGFGPLYNEDEPKIAGKGYWLRQAGWEAQEAVRRHFGWRRLWDMRDVSLAQPQSKE